MIPYNRNQIDTKQIADMLAVTRPYVTDKLTKQVDFPRPIINLSRRLRRLDINEVWDYVKRKSKSPA